MSSVGVAEAAHRRGVSLHPLVRMFCLFELGLLLPAQRWPLLLALGVVLLAAGIVIGAARRMAVALWSLRWLLFAVLLVYLAFTPGPPLLAGLPGLSRDGALQALHRVLLLCDLVLAVAVLLHRLPAAELAAALATPLAKLGDGGRRFAVRLALSLDALAGLSERLRGALRSGAGFGALAVLCADVEDRAGQADAAGLTLPVLPAPAWAQWLVPLAVAVLLAAAAASLPGGTP